MYKNIIFDIGDVLFSYEANVSQKIYQNADDAFMPIRKAHDIVKQLHEYRDKDDKPRFQLFILSNFSQDGLSHLWLRHPELFDCFDGIVISGVHGSAQSRDDVLIADCKKPDPFIYNHLLESYDLHPHESLFIDDKIENVEGAEGVGMKGILYTCSDGLKKQFEELGILPESELIEWSRGPKKP